MKYKKIPKSFGKICLKCGKTFPNQDLYETHVKACGGMKAFNGSVDKKDLFEESNSSEKKEDPLSQKEASVETNLFEEVKSMTAPEAVDSEKEESVETVTNVVKEDEIKEVEEVNEQQEVEEKVEEPTKTTATKPVGRPKGRPKKTTK